MELNGILPVHKLVLSLSQSVQPDQVPSEVGVNEQMTVLSKEEGVVRTIPNPSTDTLLKELPISKIIPNLLAYGIQGMDAQALAAMFQKLGMDYEKRLWKAANLPEPFQNQELQVLKDTLKAQLISTAEKDHGAKLWLDALTGFQMKQASDHDSHVYLIMDLPYCFQEKVYQTRIAVHGNKKGKAIDTEHCRIGLKLETDFLGEIGIDAMFNEHVLNVMIMTNMPKMVTEIWDELKDSMVELFEEQGYQLSEVRVSPLGNKLFNSFIHGIEPKGVDIEV